jgi:hypothetical protein
VILLLTIAVLPLAVWAIDRWMFAGEFVGLVRDEIAFLTARRGRRQTVRKRVGAR